MFKIPQIWPVRTRKDLQFKHLPNEVKNTIDPLKVVYVESMAHFLIEIRYCFFQFIL